MKKKSNYITLCRQIAKLINWRYLSIKIAYCPVCECKRIIIRLNCNELAIRCTTCRASAITMSLISILRIKIPDFRGKKIYELSSRGPLFRFLSQNVNSLSCSEYFEDVTPGHYKDGVQCQDVQCLTFPDEIFDVCTSTEVFEHVANDLRAFAEIHRVLKPEGILLFTVPISSELVTVERAKVLPDGNVQHVISPEYHGDPIREYKQVLTFRNYGMDIITRIKSQGFEHVEIIRPEDIPWDTARSVIIAYRKSTQIKTVIHEA